MRETTLHALNALNRTFYAAIADEWSESRQHPWPGFARVLERACARKSALHVLDVGAGDGRFAEYLSARCPVPFSYLGVDLSPELIERAGRRRVSPGCRFVQADIVDDERWLHACGTPAPGLVTLLGVMHHVPSRARRARLLRELGAVLEPGGLLAATFWRLPADSRFERRVVPWAAHNARAAEPVDETDLEPGDTLLAWGAGDAPPRYCHFADEVEIGALVADSGLDLVERFRADGRGGELNEYVLLTAPGA